MQKTILIPTDFKPDSLKTLTAALNKYPDVLTTVVLVYAEILSDSITDLLFYSQKKKINALLTPDFEESLEIIKNRFTSIIEAFKIIPFHSHSEAYRDKFLSNARIDEIYLPAGYKLQLQGNAFDPCPLFKKSKLPVFEVSWDSSPSSAEIKLLKVLSQ